jgi:GAF domain-containing protein
VLLKDGGDLRFSAHHGPIPINIEKWPISRNWTAGRAFVDRRPVHVPDMLADEGSEFPDSRELSRYTGSPDSIRTVLSVPLLRENESIGTILLRRTEVLPFSDKQIALLQTFADQAVIAIGNVHLFDEVQAKTRELEESLEYQIATADVLNVISRSTTNVQPVFDAIAMSAARLFTPCETTLTTLHDGQLHWGATASLGRPVEAMERVRSIYPLPFDIENSPSARAIQERRIIEIADASAPATPNNTRRAQSAGEFRSITFVPLLRDGIGIGTIILTHPEAGFKLSPKQLALVQTFADQAVIAIENARLFDEVQAKTRELEEALTYQTGSSNILGVIASSPTDVGPVVRAIVERACELCEADDATVVLRDGDELVFAAQHGSIPVVWQRLPMNRRMVSGRAVIDGKPVHLHDLLAPEGEQFTDAREFARRTNVRTVLSVPLLRESAGVGAIVLRRTEVRPFSDKQISLLQTFADQAVIAIGNVRLFEEVQARTRDLTESLQQQTATAEVLRVISASPGELQPVFQAMLENAVRLCEAKFAMLFLYEENQFRAVGKWNLPPAWSAFLGKNPFRADPKVALGRVAMTKQPVHIVDVLLDQSYIERFPGMVGVAELGGARTLLQVPMLKENELVGTIGIYRQEVRPFTDKQIALVQNFAAQAVIAIENARLLNELRQRTDDLTASLDDLRTAQGRLIQTEKLASLGQLTAGIAHEIKNPLNFVNNFSALSAELTDELNNLLKSATLSDKIREEVDELTRLLKDNLEKVVQHGKRADSIVKNMLLHSREGSGDHRPADINALLDESLNLAYHGARAEKPQFNVTLQRDFDERAGTIEVFPQEITRVFLNLISNGFYAVTKRKTENGGSGFDPVLRATTRNLGDAVEIRIRDNGTGIPAEVKEKMFNPFFTTKPAGEGTGLGLSMSHDIIVKQHGGTIDVATEPGRFTEFTIVLPRTSNLQEKKRGQP